MRRGQRSGLEDRWHRPPRNRELVYHPADAMTPISCMDAEDGKPGTDVCTARHGVGRRWLARWVDQNGQEHTQSFDRKADAQPRSNQVTADMVTNTYVDTRQSAVLFRTVAKDWLATQRTRVKPSTFAGCGSVLRVTVLPRWGDIWLSDITYTDLQQWVTWMTTSPDARQPRTIDTAKNAKRNPLSALRAVQARDRGTSPTPLCASRSEAFGVLWPSSW